jgi:hypothetical protein
LLFFIDINGITTMRILRAKIGDKGASLVELVITFPIALTIVLASIHLSHIARESGAIVEAARHAGRASTAASAGSAWTAGTAATGDCISPPTSISLISSPSPLDISRAAACGYLEEYFGNTQWNDEKSKWEVSSQIISVTEGGENFLFAKVTLRARYFRGPVDSLKAFFGLKPSSTVAFPLSLT